ncbi:MAG: sigma-70 family RNA polymerase sigma factor [bacterium]|nr:sigma-70 family RNA polymerase sigma factor [bacterium]
MVGVDADQDLFERFRTRGDVDALGELFDLHATALLRVALHLTKDPASAEDLVQATFLRAIEVRESFDSARALLPWLVGVLHNRARHHRWQVERRPDAARIASPRPADPVAAATNAEFDAAIDAAIAEQPEAYRPVLRMHLVYGHQPAEIAHVLDRPPATVRSQLARGLERLRRLLPASFAGVFAAALLPGQAFAVGAGMAAVKQSVLTAGGSAVAVGAGSGAAAIGSSIGAATPVMATATTAIGGTLAMKKTVLIVAAVVIAVGFLFAVDPFGSAAQVAPDEVGVVTANSGAMRTGAAATDGAPPPANDRQRAEPAGSSTGAATGALRVECRFAVDSRPAWGLFLELVPGIGYESLRSRVGRPGEDGAFEFTGLRPGDYVVRAGRGGECKATIVAGSTVTAELIVPTGIDVQGRVVDATGADVPHAAVWLSRRRRAYAEGCHVIRADGAGRFFLRSVEPERFLSAVAPGLRAAVVAPVRGEVGSAIEVELVLQPNGVTLRGVVVDPAGDPLPGARALIGARESAFAWTLDMHSEYRPPVEVVADGRGEFVVHGFEPGSTHATWVRSLGFAPWYRRLELEDSGETFVRIGLDRGATVRGTATDGSGAPVTGAFVSYRAAAWAPYDGYPHQFSGPRWALGGAVTDGEGNYELARLPAGELRLVANHDEREARGDVVVANAATARWDPVLIDVVFTGKVVDERGAPIAGVDVTGQTARGKGHMVSALTDADGMFVCKRGARRPYNLRFFAPGDELRARPAAVVYGVMPGAPLEVRIDDSALPTCTIAGRLLDSDGNVPADGQVCVSAAGLGYEPRARADPETGAFAIGPLPAGTYRAQGRAGDPVRRSAWSATFEVVAGVRHDVGVLQMPAPGTIEITATGPDGQPLTAGDVVLEYSTGWSESRWSSGVLVDGRRALHGIAPGSYRVGVDAEGFAAGYADVTVVAGETATVEVKLGVAVQRRLQFSATTEPVPIDLTFDWQLDGRRLHRYVNRWEGQKELAYTDHLRPGRYELIVTSERGTRAVSYFEVGPDDEPGTPIRITLP